MKSPEIEVKCLAAAVFAHLCCDGFHLNYSSLIDWPKLLEEMVRNSNILFI